ncbi:hypothetical protein [Streptomyces atratus]|uniref:hypothetical protein n=1 Tax=Streptomyces atratus TaxID=1893 RepID=UPI003F6986E4
MACRWAPSVGAAAARADGPYRATLPRPGPLVLTAGSYGNVLRFLPPLSIPDTLLDEGLGLLGEVIAQECGTGV